MERDKTGESPFTASLNYLNYTDVALYDERIHKGLLYATIPALLTNVDNWMGHIWKKYTASCWCLIYSTVFYIIHLFLYPLSIPYVNGWGNVDILSHTAAVFDLACWVLLIGCLILAVCEYYMVPTTKRR